MRVALRGGANCWCFGLLQRRPKVWHRKTFSGCFFNLWLLVFLLFVVNSDVASFAAQAHSSFDRTHSYNYLHQVTCCWFLDHCMQKQNLQVHYWLASQVSARLVGISHNSNKSSLHNLFDMVLIILTINLFACLYFLSDLFICTRHFSPPLLSRGWVLQQ